MACWQLSVCRLHQFQTHSSLQVGYVIPGVKDVHACRVGDTWHLAKTPVRPLPGFRPVKPMVFAGRVRVLGCCGGFADMNLCTP